VRLSVPPQHQLVGLIGRHKKVPYLSVGISITMILRSRSQQEVRMSAEAPKAAVEDLIAKVVGGKALGKMSNRPELVRQLVALSRRTFFLRSRRCGPTFATAT
jgi:hypothetical protein